MTEQTAYDGRTEPGTGACLYLVHVGNMVKVGITNDPHRRRGTLQTTCPEPLSMPYLAFMPTREMALRAETAIHKRLAHRRVSGEWFRVDIEEATETAKTVIRRNARGNGRALPEIEFPSVEALLASASVPWRAMIDAALPAPPSGTEG